MLRQYACHNCHRIDGIVGPETFIFLSDWVRRIPMAALVAVMIVVSIGTFNWASLRNLVVHPKSSSIVMSATVAVVVFTHDLAKGVLVGVLLSGVFFARKVGHVLDLGSTAVDQGKARNCAVTGQFFFASADSFVKGFDFKGADRARASMFPGRTSGTSRSSMRSTRSCSSFVVRAPTSRSSA